MSSKPNITTKAANRLVRCFMMSSVVLPILMSGVAVVVKCGDRGDRPLCPPVSFLTDMAVPE
jgi:hypothetical protein